MTYFEVFFAYCAPRDSIIILLGSMLVCFVKKIQDRFFRATKIQLGQFWNDICNSIFKKSQCLKTTQNISFYTRVVKLKVCIHFFPELIFSCDKVCYTMACSMTKVGLSSRMMLPASISLDAISPNPFRWTLARVNPTHWGWWFLYSMAWHSLLETGVVTI